LQQCPYNSIDSLGVEDSCGGVFDDRAPDVAGQRLVGGLAAVAARGEAAAAAVPGAGGSR